MLRWQLKDSSLFIGEGFIGGEWLEAKNGKTFPVYGMSSARLPPEHN
jgi:hypothetical protein